MSTSSSDTTKLCECGCGKPTPIATITSRKFGRVKGQPLRFVWGHNLKHEQQPLEARFWKKVDKEGPSPSPEAIAAHPEVEGKQCWVWTGSLAGGYGHFWMEGKPQIAHRIAWLLETGELPQTLCLHKCDNPLCVRFNHLFEGTNADNSRDRDNKNRNAKGDKNGNAKLKESQIEEIRARVGGGETRSALARELNVDMSTISRVVSGERWGD